jgi:hypothetical protein
MKLMCFALISIALLCCAPAFSQIKPCEELKSEIEAKIKKNGVVHFTLEIVPADELKDKKGKVVGSCDGGKNKILYNKEVKETNQEATKE